MRDEAFGEQSGLPKVMRLFDAKMRRGGKEKRKEKRRLGWGLRSGWQRAEIKMGHRKDCQMQPELCSFSFCSGFLKSLILESFLP